MLEYFGKSKFVDAPIRRYLEPAPVSGTPDALAT